MTPANCCKGAFNATAKTANRRLQHIQKLRYQLFTRRQISDLLRVFRLENLALEEGLLEAQLRDAFLIKVLSTLASSTPSPSV